MLARHKDCLPSCLSTCPVISLTFSTFRTADPECLKTAGNHINMQVQIFSLDFSLFAASSINLGGWRHVWSGRHCFRPFCGKHTYMNVFISIIKLDVAMKQVAIILHGGCTFLYGDAPSWWVFSDYFHCCYLWSFQHSWKSLPMITTHWRFCKCANKSCHKVKRWTVTVHGNTTPPPPPHEKSDKD